MVFVSWLRRTTGVGGWSTEHAVGLLAGRSGAEWWFFGRPGSGWTLLVYIGERLPSNGPVSFSCGVLARQTGDLIPAPRYKSYHTKDASGKCRHSPPLEPSLPGFNLCKTLDPDLPSIWSTDTRID